MTNVTSSRPTTPDESREIIKKCVEEYTSLRLNKKQFLALTGRKALRKSFIFSLREELADENDIVMWFEKDYDKNITGFIFTSGEHMIKKSTNGNFCARGRYTRWDSLGKMIRTYADPIIEENDWWDDEDDCI